MFLQMFDFVDVSLVFLVAVLAGYAVYAVRAVLAAQSDEEQLWVDTPNMHYIPFSLRQLQSALLGANDGSKGAVSVPQWREFIIKTELVFNARYHLLKTALLDDFEPFDPNLDVPNELPESKLQLLEVCNCHLSLIAGVHFFCCRIVFCPTFAT